MPAAISAYGRSKQAGETSTQIANPRHFIVRSSWLFGVGGPNFVETMLRVGAEQPEVIVVSDQVASPTYTSHLAAALVELGETGEYGIHHIAGAGSCSWFDYAQEIFDQAGVECRVMAGTTEMLDRPAPRPALSLLVSERPDPIVLPDWRRGLAEYLSARTSRDLLGRAR
jgi:dTDP-4-dehydrorhamnose reductase